MHIGTWTGEKERKKMVSGLFKGIFPALKTTPEKKCTEERKIGNTQLNPNSKYKYYACITSNWSANAPFFIIIIMHAYLINTNISAVYYIFSIEQPTRKMLMRKKNNIEYYIQCAH